MAHKPLPAWPSMTVEELVDHHTTEEFQTATKGENARVHSWAKYGNFLGLAITTVFSLFLLVSHRNNWTQSGAFFHLISKNRATTQIIVQILANGLSLIYISIICNLINYATRIRFRKLPVTLDVVRLWSDLCAARVDWDLPLELLTPLLCFVALTALPSGLWAGALTPIATTAVRHGSISIPGYSDSSMIKEFPSEISRSGPLLRNRKGLFSYSVGVHFQGSILSSAASASPVDGGVRQHAKNDNSRFTYFGRSYGVGAPVGLIDNNIISNNLATAYAYEEPGYKSVVSCIYNSSTDFVLSDLNQDMLYAASGNLPDSIGQPEYSVYVGHSMSAIVAIGVAHDKDKSNKARILAIAAGESYATLNATQCSIRFVPIRFNVTVGLLGRNITVTPASVADDIEPSGNLTHVVMRQFELISNDQTNIYNSLVGSSFNASISDYKTSQLNASANTTRPSDSAATLAGLTNSVTAMADDLLVGYASAQLMIGNHSVEHPARIEVSALRFGQGVYIYAVFALNALVMLLVVAEAVRTHLWRELLVFDYMDTRSLILGQLSSGGEQGAGAVTGVASLKEAGGIQCSVGDGPRGGSVGFCDADEESPLDMSERLGAIDEPSSD